MPASPPPLPHLPAPSRGFAPAGAPFPSAHGRLALAALLLAGGGGGCAPDHAPGDAPLPPVSVETVEREAPFPTLLREEACLDAGYLCDALDAAESPRILRWPDGEGPLTVHVPRPPGEDAALARALQQAAVRGILAWDGHPFRLVVEEGEGGGRGAPDIEVSWHATLGVEQAGRVRTLWEAENGDVRFQVESFELALAVSRDGGEPPHRLAVEEVERVAAHEMGHALGLGHSPDAGDVMYPTNPRPSLSPRDYRSVHALYGLPAGALLAPPD